MIVFKCVSCGFLLQILRVALALALNLMVQSLGLGLAWFGLWMYRLVNMT